MSDAVTVWIPLVSGGAVNAQELKLPPASALQFVETGLPSKPRAMSWFGSKPVPLTALLLPTLPAPELRRTVGLLPVFVAWPEDVTLAGGAGFRVAAKVAAEYVVEAEFALLSDAVTVWFPPVSGGGVNAQELKLPPASALQFVETGLPLTRKVMVLFGAKPLPLTATL